MEPSAPFPEANANRYTFVWRGSMNYHLAGLLDTIDTLYTNYNTLLHENGYGAKYGLGDARMFVIEGMEKVRRVIKEYGIERTVVVADKGMNCSHNIDLLCSQGDGYVFSQVLKGTKGKGQVH